MTDFFENQETARRNTFRLVFLFTFSVLAVIGITYFVFWGIYSYEMTEPKSPMPGLWQPALLAMVAGGVSLIVGCGSIYKIAELSSGGKAVALLVGGREIQRNTKDLRERRILNVVEEMAIASGVPVPPVYLLAEEDGINAFAAGHSTEDAVVAVSRGCLDYLTRDELQGVVGHEFSHILNGDMRLNIRLMGLIHGLLVLSLVGYYHMQAGSNSRTSDKEKGSGQLFFAGLALYVLGSLGAFFGTLIQAGVSRQREYLADASSVQFTRNPDGIAGALKKIGGLEAGSTIANAGKAEVAHMFFAECFRSRFFGLFASHPPLEERIRKIDPQWDGRYPQVNRLAIEPDEMQAPSTRKTPGPTPTIPGLPQAPIPVLALAPEKTSARVGRGTVGTLSANDALQESIPAVLRDASQEPFSARALIYVLLLDRDAEIREKQLAYLRANADPRDVTETLRLQKAALDLTEAARLPLLDLSIPALRQMSLQQYQSFRAQMSFLIDADQQLSLFEYTLSRVLTSYLDRAFQLEPKAGLRYRTASALAPALNRVLSKLAWEGAEEPSAALPAYAAGMSQFLGEAKPPALLPEVDCKLPEFDRALKAIRDALPELKRKVVDACSTCITADGKVTLRESELLRAICAVLACPLPVLAADGEPAR